MTTLCASCRNECDVSSEDQSFDHAFGTESGYSLVSKCCGDTIYQSMYEFLFGDKTVMVDFKSAGWPWNPTSYWNSNGNQEDCWVFDTITPFDFVDDLYYVIDHSEPNSAELIAKEQCIKFYEEVSPTDIPVLFIHMYSELDEWDFSPDYD